MFKTPRWLVVWPSGPLQTCACRLLRLLLVSDGAVIDLGRFGWCLLHTSGHPHTQKHPHPNTATPHHHTAVGIVAGVLSTFGYETLSPALEKGCKITDTCGVANLHGMPGIFGGLASALFSWLYHTPQNIPLIVHGTAQPLYQLVGLGTTLGLALASGLLAGFVVSRVNVCKQELGVDQMFDDAIYWHEVEEEE